MKDPVLGVISLHPLESETVRRIQAIGWGSNTPIITTPWSVQRQTESYNPVNSDSEEN